MCVSLVLLIVLGFRWVPLPMRTVSEAMWETWVSDQISAFPLTSPALTFTVAEASIHSYQL